MRSASVESVRGHRPPSTLFLRESCWRIEWSSDVVFVAPPSHVVADVVVANRLTFGTGTAFALSAQNQVGMFIFDRAAGQRFTLAVSSNFYLAHMQVLRPDGVVMYASGAIYPTSFYFTDAMTAPVTGTYTLVFDPDDAYGVTGNGSVTVNDVPRDITGEIVAGGAPTSFTIGTQGQNARVTFFATANQRVVLTNTNTTIPYSGIMIQAPDGSVVIYGPRGNNGILGPVYLPLAGQYGVLVNPFDWYTGAMTLTLYNVDPDISQEVPTDGTPTTFTPTPFQTVLLTTIAPASPDGPLSIPTSVPRPCEAENGMQCG